MSTRFTAAIFLSIAFASPVHAQTQRTIQVDPIADQDPSAGCTLREAVHVANAGVTAALGCTATSTGSGMPVVHVLVLPAYTYTLSGAALDNDNISGDLDVQAADLRIVGAGPDGTIVDGNGLDRLFHIVVPSASLKLTGMTLRNGRVTGTGGTAKDDDGGAVYNDGGTLQADTVVFAGNAASGASFATSNGGAIITVEGDLELVKCTFVDNVAQFAGGAIAARDTAASGTQALTIVDTELRANRAKFGGALAIETDAGTAAIVGSRFVGNRAQGSAFSPSTGGAIDLRSLGVGTVSGTVNIERTSMSDNHSEGRGGAIHAALPMSIANSSLLANRANSDGGALLSANWTQWLTNVTIAGNVADADGTSGGDGGGIFASFGDLHLKNTVVAANLDPSGGGPDCFGMFQSSRSNAIGNNQGCLAAFPAGAPNANGDFVGTPALPLDVGLPTALPDSDYLVPSGTSVLVDRVVAAECRYLTFGFNPLYANGAPVLGDQLGNERHVPCDIGAVELSLQIFSSGFED